MEMLDLICVSIGGDAKDVIFSDLLEGDLEKALSLKWYPLCILYEDYCSLI